MWMNYSGNEFIHTAKLGALKKEQSPSPVHVLPKTIKLVISHCCFAGNSKEMHLEFTSLHLLCATLLNDIYRTAQFPTTVWTYMHQSV